MSEDIFQALFAPFPVDLVSWRVGSTNKDKTKGMALAFIDARDVMDRLDNVLGPGHWQCSYPHANGKTVCRIELRINGEWVGKEDGAGDTDVEAEKGALSDAFKRAAVRWGIGRYLYDLPSPWVALEAYGNPNKPSYKIADSEYQKLRGLLAKDAKQHQPAPRASEKPQNDDTPFDEPVMEPRARLVIEWAHRIDKETDAQRLLSWWTSEQREKTAADIGLTQDDRVKLRNLVIDKKAKLEGRVAA
ncbi:Rad52/Rad22 family DNA repair protein [Xanthobacter sp. ZOL 2024]